MLFPGQKHFSRIFSTMLLCAGFCASADLESARRAYGQKDYAAALKEFAVLAEQGDPQAQVAVGRMYMIGEGVSADSGQAARWFRAAALQGDAEAQFFLGSMYLLPRKDIGEGVKWLRLSAGQGMQDAQFLLGKAYLRGAEQLPRDPVQADMWLRLAAQGNKQFYQDELAAAERQIAPNDIAKAKALAAEWKPQGPKP